MSGAECADEVLKEINAARTDPSAYAAHLAPMLKLYEGKLLRRPGEVALMTQEGVAAVEEAVRFLQSATPLPPLEPDTLPVPVRLFAAARIMSI